MRWFQFPSDKHRGFAAPTTWSTAPASESRRTPDCGPGSGVRFGAGIPCGRIASESAPLRIPASTETNPLSSSDANLSDALSPAIHTNGDSVLSPRISNHLSPANDPPPYSDASYTDEDKEGRAQPLAVIYSAHESWSGDALPCATENPVPPTLVSRPLPVVDHDSPITAPTRRAPQTLITNVDHSSNNLINCMIPGPVNMIHVNGNYITSEIIYQPGVDATASPLPGTLHRTIQRNAERLLPIFGVAMAFHTPPSVLQISRVLDLKWTEVRDAVKPISSYLESLDSPINFYSDIRLPGYLKGFLLQRSGTLWIDPAKYHAIVARWCLVGQRSVDARDITYAGEYWAYHVRHSTPCKDLFDALRASRLPLNAVSRQELRDVVHWLKGGGPEAHNLMSRYQERLRQPPELVSLMGGMLNMFF
ncbi:hypothetical protein B0H11DRAFT_2284255 [Mycena galericulata]|nr:hypothetical protein B0H11DRAFT_2284255 [Mycena galericulata]